MTLPNLPLQRTWSSLTLGTRPLNGKVVGQLEVTMPKIVCPCGYVHRLGEIPDAGWVAVLDREYESLVAAEVALSRRRRPLAEEDDPHLATIGRLTTHLYECPSCGLLAWLRGSGKLPEFFTPLRDKQ